MRPRVIALALVLALVIGPAARAEEIVAVAAPLSGRHRAAGEEVRRAAELAVAALNAQGGVLGQQLALAAEDDGCEAAQALAAARTLADRRPALVVGHTCSSAALAAAPVYAAANLLFVSPAARHPALTQKRASKTIFRLAGRDDRQGAAAALWLAREAGERPVAVVHDPTSYARSLARQAAEGAARAGLSNVIVVAIRTGQKDYGEAAARLKDAHVGALFFAGFPAEAALLLGGVRALGLDSHFLGSDSLAGGDFAAALPSEESSVRVLLPNDPPARPGWIRASFEREHGSRPPSVLMARTYAAVEAWADAARRASSFEPDRVGAVLERYTIDTSALGPLSFDDNGDARVASYVPARWDGGSWVPSD